MKGLLAKFNRIIKRNISKKDYVLLRALVDSEPQIETPNLHIYPKDIKQISNEQLFDHLPSQRDIPGEFYQPDPEILEMLRDTKIIPDELNRYGIRSRLPLQNIPQEDLAHEELVLQLSGKSQYHNH
jgi:hypothetical protein